MGAVIDQPVALRAGAAADADTTETSTGARVRALLERWRWHLWVLLALTVFSGFLRFYWIDRPSLWNDEAHTFRRMTISFQYLLDILSADGFGPLMYEWYYWLGQRLGGPENLTPFWMRLLPCICGTAMTPAMYFLARQMCSKRTSLVVAGFTACSAYLMAYSHDAKMYMEVWLFAALNVACFLWWMRSGLRAAWLAWIATGLAAVGFHAPALIVIGLQPLFLLTRIHVQWRKLALFAAGMAVIASGPLVHYTFFDRWSENVEEHGWDDQESGSGLAWIKQVIGGRDDGDLMRFAAAAYLLSWEWPADAYEGRPPAGAGSGPRGRQPATISVGTPRDEKHMGHLRNQPEAQHVRGSGGLMLQGFCIDPRVYTGLKTAFWTILLLAGLGLMPWPQRWRGASPADPAPQHWAVTTLWLAVWAIVPAYYFYIATVEQYTLPYDWLRALGSTFAHRWLILVPVLIAACVASVYWRVVPLAMAGAAGLIFVVSLLVALVQAKVFAGGVAWWQAPSAIGQKWAAFGARPVVVLLALMLILPVAWYYSDRTVKGRLWRVGQLLLIAGVVYGLCRLVAYYYEYKHLKFGTGGKTPIWMPRYFGVIWPALAIAVCVLFMRLPTRPMRYVAVALLLGVNLAQCLARFAFGEPPVDHIIADAYGLPGRPPEAQWARGLWSWEERWKAWGGRQGQPPDLRTYVAEAAYTAHPAGGSLTNRVGRYYISIVSGRPYPTHQYPSGGSLGDRFQFASYSSDRNVALEIKRSPQIKRLIIWDRHTESPEPGSRQPDPLAAALGPEWKREGEWYFPVYFHWNWSEIYTFRRREYMRLAGQQEGEPPGEPVRRTALDSAGGSLPPSP